MQSEQKEYPPMERLEKYIKDVETIRHTLETEEDLLIIKPWALISWGVWTLLGTGLSWLLGSQGFSAHRLYLAVWLPVILIGGFFETIAWIRQTRQEAIPLFTKRFLRSLAGAAAAIVSFMVFLWFFLDTGLPLAGPILLAAGTTLLLYCQLAFHDSYPEALVVFAGGLVFTFGQISGIAAMLVAGALPAVAMIEAGIRYSVKGNQGNG